MSIAELSKKLVRHAFASAALSMKHSMELEDGQKIEVRWMTTDASVCVMDRTDPLYVADVRKKVHETAGIPIEQQRLLVRGTGAELPETVGTLPDDVTALSLVRSRTDARVTNLSALRPASSAAFPEIPAGRFRAVNKVANGINGNIWKYVDEAEQECVAVKIMRNENLLRMNDEETDDRTAHMNPRAAAASMEDALTEIGVLQLIANQAAPCKYILKLRGVFANNTHTWLMTEFADGGELFNVAQCCGQLAENTIREYMRQLLEAVEYIHKLEIGHRDISLENVLLKNGEVRLMDFGMACRTHTSAGTPLRYFRPAGKNFYRPAEMYVPRQPEVKVLAPDNAMPGEVSLVRTQQGHLCEVRWPDDVVPGSLCMAEPWGYVVPPADIFMTAICFFMLTWQCPAWQNAWLTDRIFTYALTHGLEKLIQAWGKRMLSAEAMQLLKEMTEWDPARRPSASECLRHPWFAES